MGTRFLRAFILCPFFFLSVTVGAAGPKGGDCDGSLSGLEDSRRTAIAELFSFMIFDHPMLLDAANRVDAATIDKLFSAVMPDKLAPLPPGSEDNFEMKLRSGQEYAGLSNERRAEVSRSLVDEAEIKLAMIAYERKNSKYDGHDLPLI